ncbi:MAG: ATP synthase F0 subunit B [Oscillatoriales cyanobacterium SM2_1_8]|nr:ATP synthase F0 subunit B [Oscillatoriales cyanobacterium SM2_1_8]
MTNAAGERADGFLALHRELDRLEEMLLDSGPRIMGRTVIDEERVCQQIDRVRLNLPQAIAKAEELLQMRQEILEDAERYAEQIEASAKARAERMLEESGILRQAEQEAERLRRTVHQECEELRQQTLEEVNQMRRQTQKEIDALRQRIAAESDDIQRGADEYSDRSLATLEMQLIEMLKIVQNGRKELRRHGN